MPSKLFFHFLHHPHAGFGLYGISSGYALRHPSGSESNAFAGATKGCFVFAGLSLQAQALDGQSIKHKCLTHVRHLRCIALRGGGGIRTPGTLLYNSFQDCRHRPLGHTSSISDCKDKKIFLFNVLCAKFWATTSLYPESRRRHAQAGRGQSGCQVTSRTSARHIRDMALQCRLLQVRAHCRLLSM